MNPLADRVRAERLGRGWSVRDAARASGISNTWWGKFEDGLQPLTDGIIAGVAQAFEWPENWATLSGGDDRVAELERQVLKLSADLAELQRDVGLLGGAAVRGSRQAKHVGPK